MDDDQVYFRSPSGDEAVLQPMRLLQQNLRRALNLVDGKHSVSEIAARFGDPGIARAALSDLARAGLIETAEGRAVRQAQASPARTGNMGESAPRVQQAEIITPGPGPSPAPKPAQRSAPPPASPLIEEISLSDDSELDDDDLDFSATMPWGYRQPGEAPHSLGPATMGPSTMGPRTMAPRSISGSSKGRPPTDEDRRVAEGKRRLPLHLAIGWPLLLTIILITLGAVTIAVAQFFPYDRYRPEVEYSLSTFLGQPVRFSRMHMTFLPQPNLTLEQVTIGPKSEVTVATAKIVPELTSLFGKSWVVKQVIADGIDVGLGGIGLLGQPRSGSVQNTRVRFESLQMANLTLNIGDLHMDRLAGKANFDATGLRSAKLESEDHGVGIDLATANGSFKVGVHALDWKASGVITVQSLDMDGSLDANGLTFPKLDGKILGGLVKGRTSLSWDGATAQVSADLDANRLDAAQVVAALAPNWLLRGDLNGRFHLSGISSNPKTLAEAVRLEGSFDIQRGNIERMDLIQAVKNGGISTRSGSTRFEALSGNMIAEGQTLALSGLQMISGVVRANGNLRVERNGDLAGSMVISLPQNQASVSFLGTLREPVLRASR